MSLAVLSMLGSGDACAVTKARALPSGVVDAGVVPRGTEVWSTIYLQPDASRITALQQFLVDVQDSGNSSYRHWLTPAQFATRFGATDAQISNVKSFVTNAGLKVESVSALRVVVSGTAEEMEAAFAPALHQVQTGQAFAMVAMQVPTIPEAIKANVMGVGGMDTLPEVSPLTLAADGVLLTQNGRGAANDLSVAVEANTVRVLAIRGSACAGDFSNADVLAIQAMLKEAAAQGITVLAASGCTTAGDVSFPAVLPEATAATLAPGSAAASGVLAMLTRPSWQDAVGLPADNLRHEPDFTVSDVDSLAQTFASILANMPAAADGSAPRIGNVNAVLYQLAPLKGLYRQPDASSTGLVGNWETATGLGVIDLVKLAEWFPRGALSDNVSITVSNPGAVHGQSITFSSTVKDVSGQGKGVVPTGTITFTTNNGVTLGPVTLSNGSASVTTSTLDASYSYTITAQYSGDSNYASNSGSTGFTIGPEAAGVSAVVSPSTPLGGNVSVAVTITSKSGVGTPTGTATVAPQGTSDTKTYSAPLVAGTSGTATATVSVPTVQAGSVTLLVNCASTSANFSCYTPLATSANITLGKSTTSITSSTTGTVTTLTATVGGLGTGYPTPTGNITFYNNGISVGSGTLAQGTVSTQFQTPTGTPSYSATYGGDNNYSSSSSGQSSTGTNTSSTLLIVTPNPPASGSTTTLQANVTSASAVTTTPTGTVTFYLDGVALSPVATLNVAGVGVYTSTTLSSTTTHTYSALYSGDTTYKNSTSNTVSSLAASSLTSTVTLTVTPNPPVSGTSTTLSAVVTPGPTGVTLLPTGTVTFYQDGVAISSAQTLPYYGQTQYVSTTLNGTGHVYTAKYSGDTSFPAATSNSVSSGSSTPGATTVSLVINSNPPVANTNNILTATLGYTAYNNATPQGTISFYQDGLLLPSGTVTLTGTTAVYVSRTLSGTTAHVYTATYSGDTNYTTNTSPALTTLAASVLATSTTLALNPATGTLTGLTATVTPSPSSTTLVPTGTVTFYQDSVALSPSVALTTAGTATLTSAALAGTGHVYSAKYSGDTNFPASTSASVTAGSTATGATTTALSISPNPPVSGSNTTLTATIGYTAVGTAVPTGTVTFYQDGVALSPASTVVGGTTATYTSSTLSGTTAHTYYAVYAGDTNYLTSKSAVVPTSAATSGTVTSVTTITASASTVTTGGSVTLTSTVVSGSGSSTTIPTGSVTFVSSTQGLLGTVALNAAGLATLSPTFTITGTQAITATYSGDSTYASSTSVSAAVVTVGTATTVTPGLTLSVSPTNTTYGATITLSSTVTAAITSGSVPVGTVTWTMTPNAGGLGTQYTAGISATSSTTGIATITIAAPAVGTYTIVATCSGTNFSCTGLSAVVGLSVGKAATAINLVASPSAPVTGQPELLTAYITLTSGATSACSGIVTFYVNSASVGTAQVSGNQATYILTLPSSTSNSIYAVYSGDINCSQSISQIVTLAASPSQTTSTVTVSSSTVLQGANVIFQVVVTSIASASTPNPGAPTGTINFYDTFNGVSSLLGSSSLIQNGANSALATFSTTGLKDGSHNVDAQYAGAKLYSPSDAGTVLVNVTDFAVTFAPSSTTVAKGQTATVLTNVTPIDNFSGQVVLGCVPPAGSSTTCSFSPNVLTGGSGITTLTITTTAATASLHRPGWTAFGGITTAICLLGLLWPRSLRRKPVLLALSLLLGSVGCTTIRSSETSTGGGGSGGGTGGTTGGTPSGTLQFTITGAGTDGRTTNAHTYQYSVTVQ